MENKMSEYVIFNVQPLELHNKAQVLVYAYLTRKILETEAHLENALLAIYEQYKDATGFKKFARPTVVGVYLYTSERLGKQDKAAWIGMLMKGPSDAAPNTRIDKLKFRSQSSLEASEGTEDEIEFEKLNKELFERGLELCSFNKRLGEIELACIHKADKKYPSYGLLHQAYVDELQEEARKEICQVHNLDDGILNKVNVFAMAFCK
jgi:hypothetical protein